MTAPELLKQYHMSVSKPRIAVVEDLMQHHVHATADEIFNRLSDNDNTDSSISRASVFNTLNTLTQKGAIRAIQIEDGVTRYDIDTSLHGHYRCLRCGKIIDFCIMRRPSMELPEGYTTTQEDYFIIGLCPNCKNKENNK